eukprot:scaffold121442_cov37-Tisochrysis_lutea.AAC.4
MHATLRRKATTTRPIITPDTTHQPTKESRTNVNARKKMLLKETKGREERPCARTKPRDTSLTTVGQAKKNGLDKKQPSPHRAVCMRKDAIIWLSWSWGMH